LLLGFLAITSVRSWADVVELRAWIGGTVVAVMLSIGLLRLFRLPSKNIMLGWLEQFFPFP
jgi:hypothetical protein